MTAQKVEETTTKPAKKLSLKERLAAKKAKASALQRLPSHHTNLKVSEEVV